MARVKYLLGLVLMLSLCISCFEEDVPGIDEDLKQDQEQSAQESDQEYSQEEEDSDDENSLPLPKTKTMQEARSLALSSPDQSTAEKIESCQQEVAELSGSAMSSRALSEAKLTLRKRVSQNQKDYHWCYIHRLVKLEDDLLKSDQTIQEKVDTLFTSFKDVWLLATALDIVTESKSYFKLSKEFYLFFNKEYLGRDLSPALPPVSADIALPREPPETENGE